MNEFAPSCVRWWSEGINISSAGGQWGPFCGRGLVFTRSVESFSMRAESESANDFSVIFWVPLIFTVVAINGD